jgi:hypothetical protein
MLAYHHTTTLALPMMLAERALRPLGTADRSRPLTVFTLDPEPGAIPPHAPALRVSCPTALLTRCSRIAGAGPHASEAQFCAAIPLRLNYLTMEIKTVNRGWRPAPTGELAVRTLPVMALPGTGIEQLGPLARLYRRGRHVLTSALVRERSGRETLCRVEDAYA